jgi:hypothetical protein
MAWPPSRVVGAGWYIRLARVRAPGYLPLSALNGTLRRSEAN